MPEPEQIIERHDRHITEVYWRSITAAQDSGLRNYHALATSLVIINGGALIAIIGAVGIDALQPLVGPWQVRDAGLPYPLDWVARLFALSMISTLLGMLIGRLADDRLMNSYRLNTTSYPASIEVDQKARAKHKLLFRISYGMAMLAVIALTVAFIWLAILV